MGAFLLSAKHPVIQTPPAATSWVSCLFAVDVMTIATLSRCLQQQKVENLFYSRGEGVSVGILGIKKPAFAGFIWKILLAKLNHFKW